MALRAQVYLVDAAFQMLINLQSLDIYKVTCRWQFFAISSDLQKSVSLKPLGSTFKVRSPLG